jgi:hypothetical protein
VDEVELWLWLYTDESGERRTFPCKLSVQAATLLKDAERVEGSRELRTIIPGSTNGLLHRPPKS